MKKGIKYLEAENKWLWYNHWDAHKDAYFIEIRQYNNKGELVQMTASHFPPKKYRVKHPTEEIK